jgi:transcriptional regulator with XRE-family HTH domain
VVPVLDSHNEEGTMPAKKKPPAKTPGEVFAAELRHIRNVHGWSQERLSEEMDRVGYPMERSTIAKIETRKRPVSLEEALALAVALGVSLKALVLPHGAIPGRVAMSPNCDVTAYEAALWFRGVSPLYGSPRFGYEDNEVDRDAERIFMESTTYGEWRVRQMDGVGELELKAAALGLFAQLAPGPEAELSGLTSASIEQTQRNLLDDLERAVKVARRELDLTRAAKPLHASRRAD